MMIDARKQTLEYFMIYHWMSIRWRMARRSRRGLTLLELVLVMAVMVTLVGIVVPLLPNLVYEAHTANGATNISELQKAMETYYTCNLNYPNGYDSLLSASGTVPMSMMWMGSSVGSNIKNAFTPYTLLANDVASLKAAGITTVYNMATVTSGGTTSATFPGTVLPAVTLSTSTPVVSVSPQLLLGNVTDANGNNVYGLGPAASIDTSGNSTYIALGVGANCTIVGAANGGVAEAPVRGDPTAAADLNSMYGRYVAIFKVDTAGGTAATLVGCGCPGGNGLGTVEWLTSNYYTGSH